MRLVQRFDIKQYIQNPTTKEVIPFNKDKIECTLFVYRESLFYYVYCDAALVIAGNCINTVMWEFGVISYSYDFH